MIRPLVAILCIALGACGSTPPRAAAPVAGEGSAPAGAPEPPVPVAATPPAPAEPAPPIEPAAPATPVAADPAKPAEPANPAQPAPPAEPAPPARRPPPPKPDPARAKADLLAAETRAWAAAKPVLQTYCASCHTQGGRGATKKKLDHFDMTGYPVAGHHAATIGPTMRSVLGLSGQKATMPLGKPGAVAGDELAAVKAWTTAWDAADKAGAHAPHG